MRTELKDTPRQNTSRCTIHRRVCGRTAPPQPRSTVRPDLVIRGWVEVDGKPHKGLDRVVNFTGLKLPDTSNAATAVTKTASN